MKYGEKKTLFFSPKQSYPNLCADEPEENGLEDDPHVGKVLGHKVVLVVCPAPPPPPDPSDEGHHQDGEGARAGQLQLLGAEEGDEAAAEQEHGAEETEVGVVPTGKEDDEQAPRRAERKAKQGL